MASNHGGGTFEGESSTTLNLTNCTISGNSSGTNGGGLINYGTLTLTGCTVSGNSTGHSGGGLSNYGTASFTIAPSATTPPIATAPA